MSKKALLKKENEGWLRIAGAIEFSNIGKTTLYELINDGSIKSSVIKKRGNTRGIRLIEKASLQAFLESQVEVT